MELVYLLIETIAKVVAVFACLMAAVAYLTLAERKILGRIQVRYGPNRVGPFGLFQPIADGLKFLSKEDIDFIVVRENVEGEYSEIGGRSYGGTEQEMHGS